MFIYVLKDPDTGDVRYVGKTNNPAKRMSGHMAAQSDRNLPSVRWVRSLKTNNKKPVMEIIEETDDWEICERKWIKFYRSKYDNLLNLDDGGIVEIHAYRENRNKSASKKYMTVMIKLSNLPAMSEESKLAWKRIKDLIRSLRISILNEMGAAAVEYFDDCIYSEFIERHPKSFRILA
jgi:hypothetical protein